MPTAGGHCYRFKPSTIGDCHRILFFFLVTGGRKKNSEKCGVKKFVWHLNIFQ